MPHLVLKSEELKRQKELQRCIGIDMVLVGVVEKMQAFVSNRDDTDTLIKVGDISDAVGLYSGQWLCPKLRQIGFEIIRGEKREASVSYVRTTKEHISWVMTRLKNDIERYAKEKTELYKKAELVE